MHRGLVPRAGFRVVPFLALVGFLLIIALLLIPLGRHDDEDEAETAAA